MNHPLPRNETNRKSGQTVRASRTSGWRIVRTIAATLAFFLATAFLPAFADEAQDEYKLGKQAFDTKQYEAAAEHYGKAAELGHSGGQNALGYCYEYGLGLRKDYAKAVEWYRKAAEQGDAKAQFNLGLCYDFGRGVTEDAAEAAEWYRKAAEQGNAKAQYNLGLCYDFGQGVTEDAAEAVEWYRKAAEQGDAKAQFSLGICYDSGRGVEADEAEAERWLRLAAEQGHPRAIHQLKFSRITAFRKHHKSLFDMVGGLVLMFWIILIVNGFLSLVARVIIFFANKHGVVRHKPSTGETSAAEVKPPPAKKKNRFGPRTEEVDPMKQMRLTCRQWLEMYEKKPKRYRLNLLGMFLINRLLVFVVMLAITGVLFLAACDAVFRLIEAYRIGVPHLLLAAILGAPFFLFIVPVFRRRNPVGMPLDPGGYARLYDTVGECCRELGTAPIRQILLDMSFRVTVLSRFRKIACIRRDILVIGYPLLCALDADSFRICLARTLRHERSRLTRDTLLKRIEFVWGLPPDAYHPGTGTLDMIPGDALPIGGAILPLQIQEEQRCDAFCRERFGAQAFDAFVAQAGVRGRMWNLPDFVLNRIDEDLTFFEGHPAEAIRDEVRKPLPGEETRRILEELLRAPGVAEILDPEAEHPEDAEAKKQAAKFFRYPPRNMPRSPEIWLKMTLPPFRERIGTDDPAALLPYLERTPDALEHYLSPGADFEAEFNRTLKESISRELFQIFGFLGFSFNRWPKTEKTERESKAGERK